METAILCWIITVIVIGVLLIKQGADHEDMEVKLLELQAKYDALAKGWNGLEMKINDKGVE